MGNRRLRQFGEAGAQQAREVLNRQFFAMAVLRQPIDG